MNKIDLKNGYFQLIADNGIRDKRTGRVYSVVVTTEEDTTNFVEVQ